ncbi:hypothetical protein DMUE_4876 [Dictyocoela muelleri]|nr:hypothetical protein DMUE_4876 [Dictyocoela muelleri]
MKNKFSKAYEEGFLYLKILIKELNQIITDLEQAAFIAYKKYFEKVKLMDVFFISAKIFTCQLIANILSNIYKNNTDFRIYIKMIISFLFLTTEMIKINAN